MRIEEFKEIVYRKEDNGIVTVTLNIPKRKNAISPTPCTNCSGPSTRWSGTKRPG